MEKITFTLEDGETVDFYVLEQTRLGGIDYILVTDSEDEDGEALILKDISAPEDMEALYERLDDEGQKQISLFVLKQFYLTPFDVSADFYEQFELRLNSAKQLFK